METEPCAEKKPKTRRRRTRSIRHSLISKLEILFAETNYSHNAGIKELVETADDDGYVSLDEFLTSNGLDGSQMSKRALANLAADSDIFEIAERNGILKIRQKLASKNLRNSCTIFVDCIPTTSDRDWITSVFSKFGTITKLDLPLHKHAPKPDRRRKKAGTVEKPEAESVPKPKHKGFAFVEFSSQSSAQSALKAFKPKISSATPSASCLVNHTPSASSTSQSAIVESAEQRPSIHKSSEKQPENVESLSPPPKKRVRIEIQEKEGISEKISEISAKSSGKQPELVGKRKKPCRRKRKRHRLHLGAEKNLNMSRIAVMGLKVLSLEDWRELRKEYLETQKGNFGALKKNLSSLGTSEGLHGWFPTQSGDFTESPSGKNLRKIRGREKIGEKRDHIQIRMNSAMVHAD